MTTPSISLHRPLLQAGLDALQARLKVWRAAAHARAERRLAQAVEHELLALDPRTLQDIGAPQGLVGQRRWADEQQGSQRERLLELRGW